MRNNRRYFFSFHLNIVASLDGPKNILPKIIRQVYFNNASIQHWLTYYLKIKAFRYISCPLILPFPLSVERYLPEVHLFNLLFYLFTLSLQLKGYSKSQIAEFADFVQD